jgi:hypothetical protein
MVHQVLVNRETNNEWFRLQQIEDALSRLHLKAKQYEDNKRAERAKLTRKRPLTNEEELVSF